MNKLIFSLLIICGFSSAAVAGDNPLISLGQCKISKTSPTNSFSFYHTVDKVLFTDAAWDIFYQEYPEDTPLPIISKPEPAMLIINSELLGGGIIFNVNAKLKVDVTEVDGKKQMLISTIYEGTATANTPFDKRVYSVNAVHKVYNLDGDHFYDYDLDMILVEQPSKKEFHYYFECSDFKNLNYYLLPHSHDGSDDGDDNQ